MAFTLEQYNVLTEAIASCTLTVKYADKEVTYRSTNDMLKILGMMKDELFPNTARSTNRRKLVSYSKGIYPTCNE